jgi:DNA repair exonuclease SbcCD ATPase subunit
MITLLNTKIQKFTHIIHLADIHIRLNKRHEEYREIFKLLYKQIADSPKETVVAMLGDIFHNKSDLSPECIQMATELFKSIADLRPLVIVAGNHDATLSNKNRLDSITPVVDALNHPNIYYLKTSGLYGFGNILWNNMCVFDTPDKYIRGQDIPKMYRNRYEHFIALFHGPIDGCSTETGYTIANPAVMTPLFDNHDMTLCGDIHLPQVVQEYSESEGKPCVRYCGSLISQNHGESLKGHGYSLWDLKSGTYKHVEIPNEIGFFTIEIHKGKVVTDLTELPKKVILRLKCFETITSEVKEIIAKLKEKTEILEISYVRMDQEADKKDIIPLCKDIVLADLNNLNYQDKLIKEFLAQKLKVSDSKKIDSILSINKHTNSLIKKDEFYRNLKWKPVRLEWSNMFAYGEENSINFEHMNGVYGIFGANAIGKSSILDCLLFVLFDKTSRAFKGSQIINIQKTSFKCKLELEIDGTRYFIERQGSKTRSGNVKVDVRFWKMVGNAEEELHGSDRRDTNDIIRDYIGTYENFILTSITFQSGKNNISFIDLNNSERKDLLSQFIGINIFDKLHEAAKEKHKEINTLLKPHKDKNYEIELQQYNNALEHAIQLLETFNHNINSLNKQIDEVNVEIIRETSELIKLDNNVSTNKEALNNKLETEIRLAKEKIQLLKNYEMDLLQNKEKETKIKNEIENLEALNLSEIYKSCKDINKEIQKYETLLNIKKSEMETKNDKISKLKTHEYDPNCKYCIKNEFVIDARQAEKELIDDKKEYNEISNILTHLYENKEKVKWAENAYENYNGFLTDLNNIKDNIFRKSQAIDVIKNELEKLKTSCNNTTEQIEIYERNKTSVELNEKTRSRISAYQSTITRLNIDLKKENRTLMDIAAKKELFKNKIDNFNQIIVEIKDQEYELDSYEKYLEVVSRDGISYQILSNAVPIIEKEINSILTQIVDFTLQLESDGQNINPYICYSNIGRYALELGSGFERFISSIALRVAMINISHLQKSTFMAIDEGFSVLDSEHLSIMSTLFSLLKHYYDFIIIISHNQVLKDAVDKSIEISHETENLSKVNFE